MFQNKWEVDWDGCFFSEPLGLGLLTIDIQ